MKLTICMVTRNCEDWIALSLRSAMLHADEIIIMDDISTDHTKEIIDRIKDDKVKFYQQPFDFHFGNQRQACYEKATGDWILWMDSDEVLDDDGRKRINFEIENVQQRDIDCIDVCYIHFVNDFGHVDNSKEFHIGLFRLHKNIVGIDFTERKTHALPHHPKFEIHAMSQIIQVYHFGYMKGMIENFIRYKRNVLRSDIHPALQMFYWRDWHYYGNYPTRPFDPSKLPTIVKEYFDMGLYRDDKVKETNNVGFWTGKIGGKLND